MTGTPSNSTPNQPDRLDQLEAALSRFAEIQLQTNVQHDERLAELEDLTARNARAIEVLTTSTTETIQLVAQQAVQAERDRTAWQAEIQRIWEYLFSQSRNGHSGE